MLFYFANFYLHALISQKNKSYVTVLKWKDYFTFFSLFLILNIQFLAMHYFIFFPIASLGRVAYPELLLFLTYCDSQHYMY